MELRVCLTVALVKDSIILPFDDRIRMTRLYEEVLTRLEEMSMITARVLKLNSQMDFAVKFNPLSAQEEHEFAAVEIVTTPGGSGCYDYREGVCFQTRTVKTQGECE